VGRALWCALNEIQHSSALGRRVVQALTRPIRHRDLRVMRGRMAGVRINLGGSFVQNLVTLRHNIALNGLTNVVIVDKALSSSTGTAEMFVSPWSAFHSLNVEGASKQDNHGAEAGEIVVETVTLDEFVQGPTCRRRT
jgi:FkbM family methyltransferase